MYGPTLFLAALLLQPAPDTSPPASMTLADLIAQPTWWTEAGRDGLDEAIRDERWAEVARLAGDLRRDATDEDAARLAFLEARARMELGTLEDLAVAAALFEGAAQALEDLQPRAWWAAARCRLGRAETGAYLAALERIPQEDPILGEPASRARCLAQVTDGAPGNDPAPICRGHLDRFGEDPDVRLALARAQLAAGRLPEAHAELVRTQVLHPTRSVAEEAGKLRGVLEAAHRDLRRPLTPAERLAQGDRFYDAYRYTDALDAAREVLDGKPKEGSAAWCGANLLGGRTRARQREQTKSMHWYDPYFEHCDVSAEADPAQILFVAGQAAFKAKMDHRCRAWLGRLAANHPGSRYADDAVILLARLALREDDSKTARGHLERLVKGIGNGDMAPEGAWLLARILWDEKRYDDLLTWVDEAAPGFRRNTDYRSQGRLLYWRARALQRTSRHADAGAQYEEIVCAYPFSWYALLSLERLEAWKQGKGQEALDACAVGQGAEDAPGPASIPAAPLLLNASVRRGLALRRLGLRDWAVEAWLGIEGNPIEDQLLLAKAAFLHIEGAHSHAHDLVRRRLPHLLLHFPVGESQFWWEVAYPRPFLPVVERHARRQSLDPWLVYGIIREESGFNPRAESYAHAMGLMQLLEKTARWMAEGTSIRVSRGQLRRPDTNVALGTKFLRYLFDDLKHPALSVAAYNCGKGGINRVRARERTRRLDEFVERIPYDQTRRYTKRVLSSAALYRHLHWGGWRPGSLKLKLQRKN
ncbi:MAG: transglycosylase SLT domain-containing protein [Pseudomonadota bacterium]